MIGVINFFFIKLSNSIKVFGVNNFNWKIQISIFKFIKEWINFFLSLLKSHWFESFLLILFRKIQNLIFGFLTFGNEKFKIWFLFFSNFDKLFFWWIRITCIWKFSTYCKIKVAWYEKIQNLICVFWHFEKWKIQKMIFTILHLKNSKFDFWIFIFGIYVIRVINFFFLRKTKQ